MTDSEALAVMLAGVPDAPAMQARFGFEASARLFQGLAERFTALLGERGSVLRFGDGRYCVMLRGLRNSGHALLAAKRLQQLCEEGMAETTLPVPPLLHVGIALYPQHAREAERLLHMAQLALTTAAESGAPTVELYDPARAEKVLEPWALGDSFAQALRTGALEVHYQPKVRIADGQIAGVEALLRWVDEGRAIASPEVFIPLAEKAGLMVDTTWYVLSNSLQLAQAHEHLPVAVNVTPGMLHDADFLEMVRAALSTWNVATQALTLEITEGALIADFDQAIGKLASLRELGVRVSIDDFGTGYSSLSYFRRIPANEVKIDKSFVLRMLTEDGDQRLVEVIINLAHQFRMQVVAEGVESAPALQALQRMGCDYAQGFLISPALAAAPLADLLARFRNGWPATS
ncbi:MAG: EAL domain-containing protein [Sinobacteraceae bacterium]|nr:EAL domain-containing protein [Nevskiaceae bacterium]